MVCLLVLVAQQTVRAQDSPDPEELADHCIRSVAHLAERCAEANADTAHECIRHIKALLERGHVEEAVRVARHCVHKIRRQSDHCVDVIHHRCRRCIHALLELGEPELARHVARACHRAVAHVRHSERRAVHAIRELFGEDDEQ